MLAHINFGGCHVQVLPITTILHIETRTFHIRTLLNLLGSFGRTALAVLDAATMTLSETNETSETPLSEKSKTTLSQISGMAGLLEYLTRDDIVASGRHTELQKKVCGYCVEKELQINSWLSGSERPYSTFGYAVEISDDVSDDVEMAESNELVSEQRSPDGLKVVMHPMVLLSISDYMTRHTMRNQPGPVVGALLGSLDGRELHLVQVFDMKLILPKDDEGVKLDLEWLAERVSQCELTLSTSDSPASLSISTDACSTTQSRRCTKARLLTLWVGGPLRHRLGLCRSTWSSIGRF